jgi:hypothetical protein
MKKKIFYSIKEIFEKYTKNTRNPILGMDIGTKFIGVKI